MSVPQTHHVNRVRQFQPLLQPTCSPGSTEFIRCERTGSVRGGVGLAHLGGHSTPVGDVPPVVARPLADVRG